jgi:hypothetical protein
MPDWLYLVIERGVFMRVVIVLSLATAAIAQTQTNSRSGVMYGVIGPSPTSAATISSIGPGLAGAAVSGAPYSAEEVTEHVQTLADGTHITQPSRKTMYYRDSLGRTRVERSLSLPPGASGPAGPNIIEISDPVSGVRYTLDPRSRTAHKLFFQGAPPLPLPPPPPATTATARRLGVQAAGPTVSSTSPDVQAQRPQFSHESLGTQTIEGVLAEGSRTTVTYPVGAVGNDRPITTVSETWTSPELKMVVLSKNSDPRNGDSTTKLINISRLEPDPTLFQIPSDYEIIEPQAPVR